jgi:hypothetical protein
MEVAGNGLETGEDAGRRYGQKEIYQNWSEFNLCNIYSGY